MKSYPIHELAQAWPKMTKPELEALAEDIRINGQFEPIELYQNEVLDGRNRYEACKMARVDPITVDVTGDLAGVDLIAYTTSRNGRRRHMSVKQIAMTVARLNQSKYARLLKAESQINSGEGVHPSVEGSNMSQDILAPKTPIKPVPTLSKIAKDHGVSQSSAARADAILKKGAPEVIKAVDNDKLELKDAIEIVKMQKKDQAKAVKAPRKARVRSKEVIKKEAKGHFGHVIRALHELGLKKGLTEEIRTILRMLS